MRKPAAALCGVLALASLHQAAWAQPATDTFLVTATVIKSCEVSAENLVFGPYDPIDAAPLEAASDIDITCTNGSDYDVGLDEGQGSAASVTARSMTGATDELNYALFRNPGRTQNWGETIDTDTEPGTGTGTLQTLTVYGRIPAQQPAPADDYVDTVTVTVTY